MPEPAPLEVRPERGGAEGGGGGGGGAMGAAGYNGAELHEVWMGEQSDGSSRLEIRLTNKDQVRDLVSCVLCAGSAA